jgi:hypothetical protein
VKGEITPEGTNLKEMLLDTSISSLEQEVAKTAAMAIAIIDIYFLITIFFN